MAYPCYKLSSITSLTPQQAFISGIKKKRPYQSPLLLVSLATAVVFLLGRDGAMKQ